PVFNEEDTIPIFYKTVREFNELKEYEIEIVFINDGSKDATESIINKIAASDPLVIPLSFTRNFGKEPALFAGLDHATGDAVIPIDVDLQDPIEVIPHLIEKWQAGEDRVLAKSSDCSTDGCMKRKTAEEFYKLDHKISNANNDAKVGDFRFMR
ncbi:glycosyltransferase family 2 protein, partial [Leptospira interrogans]|uniref:glycosyltransferase family 2 protein n=1 Tax=Leptospira interrogans TaxID=173 RepID=UPI0018819BE4